LIAYYAKLIKVYFNQSKRIKSSIKNINDQICSIYFKSVSTCSSVYCGKDLKVMFTDDGRRSLFK